MKIKFEKLKSGGYRLTEPWAVYTGIKGYACLIKDRRGSSLLKLTVAGTLQFYPDYHWDGSSGPVIDRLANYRAGLAHDGLYQLLRAGKLPQEYRKRADEIYVEYYELDASAQDKAHKKSFRRWLGRVSTAIVRPIDWAGLRLFAGHAAKLQPEVDSIVMTAP